MVNEAKIIKADLTFKDGLRIITSPNLPGLSIIVSETDDVGSAIQRGIEDVFAAGGVAVIAMRVVMEKDFGRDEFMWVAIPKSALVESTT